VRRIVFVMLTFFVMVSVAHGEDDPITKLAADTVAYFNPIVGTITHVEGKTVTMGFSEKDVPRAGMRLKVLREGEPFYHPVTKELLGKFEATVGRVEITDIQAGGATGEIVEGEAKEGDKVRISDTKVRLLFCQAKAVGWSLADDYYRKLKATGKFEMVDTALETADEAKVLEAAKKQDAEAAIILTSKESGKKTLLRERLYWVSDGRNFLDTETELPAGFDEGPKAGQEFFTPKAAEVLMKFDLPLGDRFVTMADIDGNGTQEIVLGTTDGIRIYKFGVDLQSLWEIKGSAADDYLWVDAVDLNGDKRDEIIVTSMKNGKIVSYIYGFNGSGFAKLWEGNYFLRKMGGGLIAQAYSAAEGFSGDVYHVAWKGTFGLGDKITLPQGVNIYDFVYLESPENQRLVLAYDSEGFLNLYDGTGAKVWRSSSSAGGFNTTFKKQSTVVFRDAGEWVVKDRLVSRGADVLAVQRVPLVGMAKGLGNKNSRINDYWWNGLSMEEDVVIDGIGGNVLDYSLVGDKIAVLSRPLMGIKFGNILKGANPIGSVLSIYVVRGR
jgi:hypothetical protein